MCLNEFIEGPQERVEIKQPQAFLQCILFLLFKWLQEIIPYRVKWLLEGGKTFPHKCMISNFRAAPVLQGRAVSLVQLILSPTVIKCVPVGSIPLPVYHSA